MERTRLAMRKSKNVYEYNIARRLFHAWCRYVKSRKRERIEREIQLHRCAERFFSIRLKLRTFVIWRARAHTLSRQNHRRARSIIDSRRRKHFRAWRFRAALLWREKQRIREMLLDKVRHIGSRLCKMRVLCVWRDQIKVWRKEKHLHQRKTSLLKKASRWLEELDLDEDDSDYVSNHGAMWM